MELLCIRNSYYSGYMLLLSAKIPHSIHNIMCDEWSRTIDLPFPWFLTRADADADA